uniref:Reverse transcriptase (RNA-dependent DNA polymerase) n=1 Tax=Candidatus Kentrum sp. UNK TaxID=2126344 RepID=A0A451ATV0_9GAMM|nr:MAG: hypothetical protein BECKUNK1418G_GA0071005_13141 [Candidatus Kentron sp. UNK]VFK69442.1 MAG: hypothetical protein BECKUNK1418G_GA0071005_14051 [Candidatus Kentron sp. UNK]VFK73920.1 MAG: hypothetical protein BECKUNK1418H_GA0071006_13681 [Candidatus Kentron sp. UNK]VFK73946.1 MAG: hypothetical protein BECKUNK1418H_GA0071006_13881 [Candidatus Kentron sp. UNK]
MREAFKNVKQNRGAAGIDKVSVQMFEANLQENLDALMRDLKTRDKFQPKPLRRVVIPKDKDKSRPLGIPVVTGLHRMCCDNCCHLSSNLCSMRIRSGSGPDEIVIWPWSGY